MPGALDFYNDPATQGLLGMAAGLLQSGGPQPFPHSFGQGLGAGFQGMQQAQRAALMNQLMGQQIQGLGFQNQRAQIQAQLLDRAINGQPMLGSPSPQGSIQTPPGISPSSLQSAFPGMPGGEAGALSAANTVMPQPQAPQSYFNPQQLFGQGQLYLAAGLPGGGEMISAAISHDPNIAMQMPDETMKLLHQLGLSPNSPVGQAAIRQKLTPPIANRGFGALVMGPSGQMMSDPESEAQIRRTESMKAGFETVPVTSASGATVPTFKSQLPGFPGAVASAPQMTPVPAPAPRPFTPSVPPTPTQPTQPNPADPWSTMPKLQIPQGLGQGTYQHGRLQGAATLAGELTTKASDQAAIANERLVYNTQSLDLVNTATTGKGALSIANVKNFLNSRLNVPLETMDKVIAGDANATTALNKDLINAATQKAKQAYGSRITQSEVMLQIKQASPNVDQLTATIKYLLQTDSAMSQYQIHKAQNLGKYLNQGGDPYQFEGWHSKAFPMTAAVSNIHLPNSQANAVEAQAKAAWGTFEPNKYEYRVNEAGTLQRRAK